ncbi:MAG: N-acetylmuramoyl-L-alanine amidase [Lachnospiraceae bacterium]|jgi:N-acetylmuramoyl-L-alanine amidase|nr:N-acetylmuramoyl-L-alanine amidase [Lachnospiraceae bacterium]
MKRFKVLFATLMIMALVASGCGSAKNSTSSSAASSSVEESTEGTSTEQSSGAIDESKLTVMKTADAVNVRETPSKDGVKVTLLPKDTEVKVISKDGEWTKIYLDGKEVYVSSQFLKDPNAKEEESSAATKQSSQAAPSGTTFNGSGKVICIDAGHQRKGDSSTEPIGPGASQVKAKVSGGTTGVVTGLHEYELTLQVAQKLQAELSRRGYTVVMCRTSHDVNISNSQRAAIANNANAAAFIRLHANGSTNQNVSGALTMCQRADNPFNGNLYAQSFALSKAVLNGLCQATGAKKSGVSTVNNMSGINWAKVPVTIVEMGYMTNPTEDRNMASEAYQEKLAQGIANGIDEYLKK